MSDWHEDDYLKAEEGIRMGKSNMSIQDENGNREDFTPGKLTQYSQAGTAFLPTQDTHAKLPAGVYEAVDIQGNTAARPVHFSTDGLIKLPDTEGDKVIEEIVLFWGLEQKYKEFQFAHKRGFLLHGPPGSGKSSTINQIIEHHVNKQDGVVILHNVPVWTHSILSAIKEVEPNRKLLVIFEDIDETIKTYNESEVLSILDGQGSTNNTVYIATTNYPEDLDGRVANRPSRFDRVVKIDVPSADARKLFFESKIPEQYISKDIIDTFVKESKGMSIAHCKEMIAAHFCLGQSVEEVCERLRAMKKLPTSKSNSAGMGLMGSGDSDD